MGLREFLTSCRRLLQLSRKPGRSDLWQSIKITALGIGIIGLIGFIIRYVSALLQGLSA
ncbi:protein translocase SEC61 complex subunit gamma [Candidatus Bathyarchaeota archaeon]|nr:protein translocase SEC61 complex subunit gamma [Candidatus Bathyarchaeota archaeon]